MPAPGVPPVPARLGGATEHVRVWSTNRRTMRTGSAFNTQNVGHGRTCPDVRCIIRLENTIDMLGFLHGLRGLHPDPFLLVFLGGLLRHGGDDGRGLNLPSCPFFENMLELRGLPRAKGHRVGILKNELWPAGLNLLKGLASERTANIGHRSRVPGSNGTMEQMVSRKRWSLLRWSNMF